MYFYYSIIGALCMLCLKCDSAELNDLSLVIQTVDHKLNTPRYFSTSDNFTCKTLERQYNYVWGTWATSSPSNFARGQMSRALLKSRPTLSSISNAIRSQVPRYCIRVGARYRIIVIQSTYFRNEINIGNAHTRIRVYSPYFDNFTFKYALYVKRVPVWALYSTNSCI